MMMAKIVAQRVRSRNIDSRVILISSSEFEDRIFVASKLIAINLLGELIQNATVRREFHHQRLLRTKIVPLPQIAYAVLISCQT